MSEAERIVVRLRSHGRVLVLPAVALWLTCLVAAAVIDRVDWPLWNLVVVTSAAVLILVLTVIPLLAWLSRRITITTKRIVIRGSFGGARREIALARVHDVTVRKQGMQHMFRSGDVLVSTGDARLVTLADLPDATLVQRTITELLTPNLGEA